MTASQHGRGPRPYVQVYPQDRVRWWHRSDHAGTMNVCSNVLKERRAQIKKAKKAKARLARRVAQALKPSRLVHDEYVVEMPKSRRIRRAVMRFVEGMMK